MREIPFNFHFISQSAPPAFAWPSTHFCHSPWIQRKMHIRQNTYSSVLTAIDLVMWYIIAFLVLIVAGVYSFFARGRLAASPLHEQQQPHHQQPYQERSYQQQTLNRQSQRPQQPYFEQPERQHLQYPQQYPQPGSQQRQYQTLQSQPLQQILPQRPRPQQPRPQQQTQQQHPSQQPATPATVAPPAPPEEVPWTTTTISPGTSLYHVTRHTFDYNANRSSFYTRFIPPLNNNDRQYVEMGFPERVNDIRLEYTPRRELTIITFPNEFVTNAKDQLYFFAHGTAATLSSNHAARNWLANWIAQQPGVDGLDSQQDPPGGSGVQEVWICPPGLLEYVRTLAVTE